MRVRVVGLFSLLAAAAATALLGCSSPQTPAYNAIDPVPQRIDYKSWTLRLKENMTEQEVSTALGSQPSKVELGTCGQQLGKPWSCKTWEYGLPLNHLTIMFYRSNDDGLWRVNSWSVYSL